MVWMIWFKYRYCNRSLPTGWESICFKNLIKDRVIIGYSIRVSVSQHGWNEAVGTGEGVFEILVSYTRGFEFGDRLIVI